ncbi:hypothetical protein [Streptomyces sp. NPDC059906]|uniref:hypothetical protein n=1 Tax=Streptomyces sp. NPDC059906 TaxID=3346997 RepID=UPI00364B93A0
MTHDHPTARPARNGLRPRPGGSRRLLAAASAAVIVPALLTACGSGSATTTTSDGLTQITVGGGGSIFDTPLHVADAQGFFKKQGLKTPKDFRRSPSPPTAWATRSASS